MPVDANKVLCTEETAVDWRANAIPLDQLRDGFADLFERAAFAIQCKGYEQDDTIVDRFLLCRAGEQTHVVEAAFISDKTLLTKHLARDFDRLTGDRVDLSTVTVVGLRVVATLDEWPELPANF